MRRPFFPLFVFCSLLLALSAFCEDLNPIDQARNLIVAEEHEQAREVLAAAFGPRPTSPEVNFMLAQIDILNDQPGRAIPVLKRILNLNPDYPRARLELANAYTLKRQYSLARKEYTKVLNSDPRPPPNVVGNIETALAELKGRKPWSVKLRAGFNYDSNVNIGPDQGTILLFDLPFELTPESRPREDFAFQGGIDAAATLWENPSLPVAIRGGASYSRVDYFDEDGFDFDEFRLALGPEYYVDVADRNSILALKGVYSLNQIGGEEYSSSVGASLSAGSELSGTLFGLLNAQFLDVTNELTDERSGNAYSISANLRYSPAENYYVEPRIFYGRDDAKADFLASDQYGAALGFYWDLPQYFSIFIEPAYRFQSYDAREEANSAARDDDQFLVNVNLARDVPRLDLKAAIGFTFTDNQSNVDFNEYEREQVTLLLNKEF